MRLEIQGAALKIYMMSSGYCINRREIKIQIKGIKSF